MNNLTALDKALAKKKELKSLGKLVRLSPYQKAQNNPKSLRKAVTAFCYECMGGDGEQGARGHVRNCTAYKCPLYKVRPWQESEQDAEAANDEPTPPMAA